MTLLTDAEARQQTCPLMTYCVNERDVVVYQNGPIYVHQNCQGSDCKIGWRWAEDLDTLLRKQLDNPRRATEEDKAKVSSRRQGFCGNFGRPA